MNKLKEEFGYLIGDPFNIKNIKRIRCMPYIDFNSPGWIQFCYRPIILKYFHTDCIRYRKYLPTIIETNGKLQSDYKSMSIKKSLCFNDWFQLTEDDLKIGIHATLNSGKWEFFDDGEDEQPARQSWPSG